MLSKVESGHPARARLAAQRLVAARRANVALKEMMADCKPMSMKEGLSAQDAATELLGEKIRGWKVFTPAGEELARGGILDSVFFEGDLRSTHRLFPISGSKRKSPSGSTPICRSAQRLIPATTSPHSCRPARLSK